MDHKPLRILIFSTLTAGLLGCLYVAGIALVGVSYAVDTQHDVAIVLGNEVLKDGTPSPRLKARLDCALDLHKRGLAPEIIVSGGTGKSGHDEAAVMRDYLVSQGVAAKRIHLDSAGVNTRATANNAAALMQQRGWRSAIAVSQYFHLPRCVLALNAEGLREVAAASPRYYEWRDVYSVLREAVALPVYWVWGTR